MDGMQTIIKEREYNIMSNILKPMTIYQVEQGVVYEFDSPHSGDRLFFKCVVPGQLMIKYGYRDKKDVFLFSGPAKMEFCDEITRGINHDK